MVGVAILGEEEGARDTEGVACGLRDFIQLVAKEDLFHEIIISNIGPDINLSFNGKVINTGFILKKFPDMRYTLYFRESDRSVKRDQYRRTHTLKRESDGKEKTLYSWVYKTTMTVEAEIVLFDLVENILLAKAFETFSHSETRVEKDKENDNSLDQKLFRLFVDTITADTNYPDVTIRDIEHQYKIFAYHFLKKIKYESMETVLR